MKATTQFAPLILTLLFLATDANSQCPPTEVFQAPLSATSTWNWGAVLADIDKDGILDLAATSLNDNGVHVHFGLGAGGIGTGTFGLPSYFPTGVSPNKLATDDLNSDGVPDLAVVNGGSKDISVLLAETNAGIPTGGFDPAVNYAMDDGPWAITTEDINDDGARDLVVTSLLTDSITVFLGNEIGGQGDGTFPRIKQIYVEGKTRGVAVKDCNADQILDLIVANESLRALTIVLGIGNDINEIPQFATPVHYPVPVIPLDVAAADFNSDGAVDVAMSASGQTVVLVGETMGSIPDGTFRFTQILNSGNLGIVADDFTLDGVLDIVVATTAAKVTLFEGKATSDSSIPIFGQAVEYEGIDRTLSWFTSSDLNGDGSTDLVAATFGGTFVSLGRCINPETARPVLTDVRDVPSDQGGNVFLRWLASPRDVSGARLITGYRVWRRIPTSLAASGGFKDTGGGQFSHAEKLSNSDRFRFLPDQDEFWEAVATVPAGMLDAYGYTASTTRDSLPGDNPLTAFFVSALTGDPFVFFDSSPDSGYSVDNLAPATPQGLGGTFEDGAGVALHWNPNSEQDLSRYAIYRGQTEDFVPSEGNKLGETSDTTFTDLHGSFNYYKVSAIDIHENESGFAVLSIEDVPVGTLISAFTATGEEEGIRIDVELAIEAPGLTLRILRGLNESYGSAFPLQVDDIPVSGTHLSYLDETARAGVQYWYWLRLFSNGKEIIAKGPIGAEIRSNSVTYFVARGPNPTSERSIFRYSLGSDITQGGSVRVSLSIFDARGREVRTLFEGSQTEGEYTIQWDLSDAAGGRVAPGVYYARFKAGSFTETTTLVTLE